MAKLCIADVEFAVFVSCIDGDQLVDAWVGKEVGRFFASSLDGGHGDYYGWLVCKSASRVVIIPRRLVWRAWAERGTITKRW